MLSSISWSEFIFYLSALLFIYYACVSLLYYRQELEQLIRFGPKSFQETYPETKETPSSTVPTPSQKKTEIEILIEELGQYFRGCAKLKPVREEFIMGLQSLVRSSELVPDAAQKIQLHQYILEASQTICSIALGHADVDGLWKSQGMGQTTLNF